VRLPEPKELRYGKCEHCRVIFDWDARRRMLREAYCPGCGRALEQTTHQRRLPHVELWRVGEWPPLEGPLQVTGTTYRNRRSKQRFRRVWPAPLPLDQQRHGETNSEFRGRRELDRILDASL